MTEEPTSSFYKRPEPSRGAVERVKDIINYARTVLPSERVEPGWENYINNLITISQQDSISHKSLNTAASLVAKYNRWEHENRIRAAPVMSAPSAPVFTEGHGDFILRVIDTREGEGQYGKWILYSFEDKAGNRIKWFGKGTDILERGKWYNIRGSVSYSSYQGRLEAQLKRVNVMGEAPESRTRFELIVPIEGPASSEEN